MSSARVDGFAAEVGGCDSLPDIRVGCPGSSSVPAPGVGRQTQHSTSRLDGNPRIAASGSDRVLGLHIDTSLNACIGGWPAPVVRQTEGARAHWNSWLIIICIYSRPRCGVQRSRAQSDGYLGDWRKRNIPTSSRECQRAVRRPVMFLPTDTTSQWRGCSRLSQPVGHTQLWPG